MGGNGTFFGWVRSHGETMYLSNDTTTYVIKIGGILPCVYTIFMTTLREPLINLS
jgi:hypothetical protein